MALVDWMAILDYAAIGAVSALGTGLIVKRRSNGNNGNGVKPCPLHNAIGEDISDIKTSLKSCVTQASCNDRHSQIMGKIDDMKDDIIHRLDRLEDRIYKDQTK